MKSNFTKIYLELNEKEYAVLIKAIKYFGYTSKIFNFSDETKESHYLVKKLEVVENNYIGVKIIDERYIFNFMLKKEEIIIMIKSIFLYRCTNSFFSFGEDFEECQNLICRLFEIWY